MQIGLCVFAGEVKRDCLVQGRGSVWESGPNSGSLTEHIRFLGPWVLSATVEDNLYNLVVIAAGITQRFTPNTTTCLYNTHTHKQNGVLHLLYVLLMPPSLKNAQ